MKTSLSSPSRLHSPSRPKILLAISLCLALSFSACSTSWIDVALQDLPVLVQIATSIISIVNVAQGNGGIDPSTANQINTVAQQVQANLQLIQNLVSQYEANPQASLLGKIDAAFVATQGNLQSILNAVHIKKTALQATITASVTLAITTVVAIESLVPVPPAPAAVSGSFRTGISTHNPTAPAPVAKSGKVAIKPIAPKQLKQEYNAICTANGYGQFAIH